MPDLETRGYVPPGVKPHLDAALEALDAADVPKMSALERFLLVDNCGEPLEGARAVDYLGMYLAQRNRWSFKREWERQAALYVRPDPYKGVDFAPHGGRAPAVPEAPQATYENAAYSLFHLAFAIHNGLAIAHFARALDVLAGDAAGDEFNPPAGAAARALMKTMEEMDLTVDDLMKMGKK